MIRRELLDEWPALTYTFGILPWHVGGTGELTLDELDRYVVASRELRQRRPPTP